MKINRSILFGIFGGAILFMIYFGILTFANSLDHAIEQFVQMWYWILILTVGFGVQVGLYYYIKFGKSKKILGATSEIAASGGASTVSMIACCAHHIADLLPILGLSAVSVFLIKYQISLILIGVFLNLIGILTMLSIIQKHDLYTENNILKKLFLINIKKVKTITIVCAIFVISISFIVKFI